MTLKFGDADNDEAKSAYFSWDVLGAEIQDDGTQIDGTSGGSNNLAGVMVLLIHWTHLILIYFIPGATMPFRILVIPVGVFGP